ncbi:MAG: GNAT family N-acetyltransferase [Boseongicola sp.]
MKPTDQRLFAALDATWPAARSFVVGPWTIREGAGGGQRVSAATLNNGSNKSDIAAAEVAMRGLGQTPLFMVRHEESKLDDWLEMRGYEIVDPVAIYVADASSLARSERSAPIFSAWPPLAIQTEIWAAGGVSEPRLAVMSRAPADKISLLGRLGDHAVATTFVARHDDIAMLHALEVSPEARRRGVGATMMAAAASWAAKQGADTLVVMVTRDNAPANSLYQSLGMVEVGQYHYRRTTTVGS